MKNDFDLLEYTKKCFKFYDHLKFNKEVNLDNYNISDYSGGYSVLEYRNGSIRKPMCKFNTVQQRWVCIWKGNFKINYNYCTEEYRIMFRHEFIISDTFSTAMSEYYLNCPSKFLVQDLVVKDIETVLSTPSYAGFIFLLD